MHNALSDSLPQAVTLVSQTVFLNKTNSTVIPREVNSNLEEVVRLYTMESDATFYPSPWAMFISKNLLISRFGNLSELSSRLGEVILQELLKNSTSDPLLNFTAESSILAKELVISFKICSFSK